MHCASPPLHWHVVQLVTARHQPQQASKLQQRRATKHRIQPPVHSFLEDFQPSATAAALLGTSTDNADYRVVLQEIYNLLDHDQSPTSERGQDNAREHETCPHQADPSVSTEATTAATQTDYNLPDTLMGAVASLQHEVASLHSAHAELQRAMQQQEEQVGHVLGVVQSQLSQLLAASAPSGQYAVRGVGWPVWQPGMAPQHPPRPQ